jgi:hypothetical protein
MKYSVKHMAVAGLTVFAGVAISLWILKKGQQKSIPVVSQIANAVTPAPAASAPVAS